MEVMSIKNQYSKYFSEKKLFRKIYRFAEKLSTNILFYVLILYFLVSDKDIPMHTRLVFMAALGYFILPMDLISDLLPGLGFTDDLAFITYAISVGGDHITEEIKEKARERMAGIFGNNNVEILKTA